MTVELLWFIKSQFTSDVQSGSIWINPRMDTSNRGLSHRFVGAWEVASGFRGIQIALLMCLFILNWSWILWGYEVSPPPHKHIKDGDWENVWGGGLRGWLYLKMIVWAAMYWYKLLSLPWCGELTPDIYPSISDISGILYIDTNVGMFQLRHASFVRCVLSLIWLSVPYGMLKQQLEMNYFNSQICFTDNFWTEH
jgi:hypothetical protein